MSEKLYLSNIVNEFGKVTVCKEEQLQLSQLIEEFGSIEVCID